MAHLVELLEAKILPSEILTQVRLEHLYSECSKGWANLPSYPSQGESLSNSTDTPEISEQFTQSVKAITKIKKEEWSYEKKDTVRNAYQAVI